MPKNQHKSHKKQYYKSVDTFDDLVLEAANKESSQYRSTVYDRLKKDGRLDTFLRLLSTAASMGYTREESVRYINQYMGDYFNGEGLHSQTLKRMLERYPDVSDAWCVHRNNIAGAAVARISELIAKTSDIETLLKIVKAFDDVGIAHGSNRSSFVPTKKTITVSDVNLKNDSTSIESRETKQTIEQLMESMGALKDANDD